MGGRRLALGIITACLVSAALVATARADALPAPLAKWLHYEQKLVSRSVDPTRIMALKNHQDRRYAPESAQTFRIKTYWVDAKAAHSFSGDGLDKNLAKELVRTVAGQKQVRLIVHPESEHFYRKVIKKAVRGDDLMASATASSRTLMTWPEGKPERAFFAKVSLDSEIGGVVRTLPKGEVARSIGINNVLYASKEKLPKSFSYLPEVFGVMPRGMERGGMLIRAIPSQYRTGKQKLVPLFSLYATSGADPPMLVRLIKKSGQDPQKYVSERLIRPFAQQFMELALTHGIVMEPHAQNVLAEIGAGGHPTGNFVHRDFGGFNVDFAHRTKAGEPEASAIPTVSSRAADYHTSKHGEALEISLDNYFSGGFLFNVAKTVSASQKKGTLPGTRMRRAALEGELAAELERAYSKITGETVSLGGDLRNVAKMVNKGRKEVIKKSRKSSPVRQLIQRASAARTTRAKPRAAKPRAAKPRATKPRAAKPRAAAR